MSNIHSQELILLDTDIGSDVDDSLALAYLLKQPRANLLGITTVSGQPHYRASIVDCILKQTNREDIPVHVGIDMPLIIEQHQPQAQHFEVLRSVNGQFPFKDFEPTSTAINFLRETIHSFPKQITLLAIGPLTNIALLFKTDPEIPSLLKQLVIMGGQHTSWASTSKSIAEWNILCDPHAAAIVFASDAKIAAVGYEITSQCRLDAHECRKALGSDKVPSVLLPMAEHWLSHKEYVTFHDPLAAALIFEPNLCKLERGLIEVETASSRASGMTYWTPNPEDEHYAASSVDSDAFFDHYLKVLSS